MCHARAASGRCDRSRTRASSHPESPAETTCACRWRNWAVPCSAETREVPRARLYLHASGQKGSRESGVEIASGTYVWGRSAVCASRCSRLWVCCRRAGRAAVLRAAHEARQRAAERRFRMTEICAVTSAMETPVVRRDRRSPRHGRGSARPGHDDRCLRRERAMAQPTDARAGHGKRLCTHGGSGCGTNNRSKEEALDTAVMRRGSRLPRAKSAAGCMPRAAALAARGSRGRRRS